MTNNELLLAISDMMDTKLKAELQPLRNEMQDMRDEMKYFKGEMRNELQNFKDEMRVFKDEMQNFKDEIHSEIHQVRLFQENIIMPRLEMIESCYLDTYRRYRDNADRMDAVYEDVDLMKKVLAEHSRQLRNLA